MTPKRKIAIYGGTFSPPHVAHVRACEAFYQHIKPDELLIIPDYLPPHKEIEGEVTPSQRLKMAELAFSHIPTAKISDMEILRGGRSYTAVTLTELSQNDAELYFLCGTDMFLTLDSWYRPDIIFSLATICCIRRENDAKNDSLIAQKTVEYRERFGAKLVFIPVDAIELSSSRVREMIASGEDASALIPENVLKYIKNEGIYL